MIKFFLASSNMFSGSLSGIIGQWTSLEVFDVAQNPMLTGSLPSSIGQWTNLVHFNAHGLKLSGTIPETIGKLTNLEFAYFIDSNFGGSIPMNLCSDHLVEIAVDCDRVDCPCGKDRCSCDNTSFWGPGLPSSSIDDDSLKNE